MRRRQTVFPICGHSKAQKTLCRVAHSHRDCHHDFLHKHAQTTAKRNTQNTEHDVITRTKKTPSTAGTQVFRTKQHIHTRELGTSRSSEMKHWSVQCQKTLRVPLALTSREIQRANIQTLTPYKYMTRKPKSDVNANWCPTFVRCIF